MCEHLISFEVFCLENCVNQEQKKKKELPELLHKKVEDCDYSLWTIQQLHRIVFHQLQMPTHINYTKNDTQWTSIQNRILNKAIRKLNKGQFNDEKEIKLNRKDRGERSTTQKFNLFHDRLGEIWWTENQLKLQSNTHPDQNPKIKRRLYWIEEK